MSDLTNAIKASCTEIAENQKRIYNLGFADGKASVKHITFCVYTDWYEYFCALSGMTWRDYVNSDVNNGNFSIINGKVYCVSYSDTKYLDVGLDDEIVENGIYDLISPPEPFTLRYGGKTYTLYRVMNDMDLFSVSEFVDSSYNTLGLYIDDEGCLRTPTGEYVYYMTIGDSRDYISNDTKIADEYSFSSYSDFIAERDCNCVCSVLGYRTLYCPSGMTWQEYVNSKFNDTVSIIDDEIVHDYAAWDGALMLEGVKVKPSDVIINGATYSGVEE